MRKRFLEMWAAIASDANCEKPNAMPPSCAHFAARPYGTRNDNARRVSFPKDEFFLP